MSLLYTIAEMAKAQSEWLLFEVGKKPVASRGGQIKSIRDSVVTMAEWNQLTEKFLDVHSKKELHDHGAVSGVTKIDSEKVLYRFLEKNKVNQVTFYYPQSNKINFVPSVLDLKRSVPGIFVFTNPSRVYLNFLALQVYEAVHGQFSTRLFTDQAISEDSVPLSGDRSRFPFLVHMAEACDVCLLVGALNGEMMSAALEMAEMGKSVFIFFPTDGINSTLLVLFEELKKNFPFYGKERFVNRLKMMISQKVLFTGQQEGQLINEILPVNLEVKAHVLKEDWLGISQLLDQSPENSGILGYDQCILQLLIRRKIDIKRAFELTQNPEKFDQRLKKVGL